MAIWRMFHGDWMISAVMVMIGLLVLFMIFGLAALSFELAALFRH
ncbi:hypothetical protein U8607_11165 [Methylobacterium durans]|nr:hypothetical protein [Methylobacterium durans]MEA1832640.1 hypothetical protein [Methylobacterium durans]